MMEKFNPNDAFLPQTNGEISDSIIQNWTLQAYECYSLKCNCRNCSIGKSQYSFVCQMPKIIKELLKAHGKPDIKEIICTEKIALKTDAIAS